MLEKPLSRIGILSTKGTVLLLCDTQEKFRPTIFQFTNIVSNAARLLQVSEILSIPQILTEHYPKGLGTTVPELGAEGLKLHTKTSFSMMTESVESSLKSLGDPQQVILCGIEAQACIACTTYDLLERGMEVHIVADAVSSRSQTDRLFALSRLKQSGAFLTTTEGVLLQLVQDAKHPNFKEIQKLLAHPSPDTGLLAFFSSLYRASHTPHPADIITSVTRNQHKPLSEPVRVM
ncbi:isochorismatase domain-containing protein 2-like [Carassius carassius]|uniref:isochorismatase domain-containing protein 2-like n=1 Tax=Carassius carassius TaxID=217509 RepID=UPI002868E3B5|nr:isochorismatase domain-containing protein 2-like [Carassius carassius]